MWEFTNSDQLVSFFVSLLFGVFYCLFYDLFRAVRRVFKSSYIAIFAEDIIYFLVISFVTFFLLLAYAKGEIRVYILAALFFGFLLCRVTVSKYVLNIFDFFLRLVFAVFLYIKRFIGGKILLFFSLFDKFLKFCKKISKKR